MMKKLDEGERGYKEWKGQEKVVKKGRFLFVLR